MLFGNIIKSQNGALKAPLCHLRFSCIVMTVFPASPEDDLSQEEWQELCGLKKAIDGYPASMATDQMERFTELLVRSLYGKGNTIH